MPDPQHEDFILSFVCDIEILSSDIVKSKPAIYREYVSTRRAMAQNLIAIAKQRKHKQLLSTDATYLGELIYINSRLNDLVSTLNPLINTAIPPVVTNPGAYVADQFIEQEILNFSQAINELYLNPPNPRVPLAVTINNAIMQERDRLIRILTSYQTSQKELLGALTDFLDSRELTPAQKRILGFRENDRGLEYQGFMYLSIRDLKDAILNDTKKTLLNLDEELSAKIAEVYLSPYSQVLLTAVQYAKRKQTELNNLANNILDYGQNNRLPDARTALMRHVLPLDMMATINGQVIAGKVQYITVQTTKYRQALVSEQDELTAVITSLDSESNDERASGICRHLSTKRETFLKQNGNDQLAQYDQTVQQIQTKANHFQNNTPLNQLKHRLAELNHTFGPLPQPGQRGITLEQRLRDPECQRILTENKANPDIRQIQQKMAKINHQLGIIYDEERDLGRDAVIEPANAEITAAESKIQAIIKQKSIAERIACKAKIDFYGRVQTVPEVEKIQSDGFTITISQNRNGKPAFHITKPSRFRQVINLLDSDRYLNLSLEVIDAIYRRLDHQNLNSNVTDMQDIFREPIRFPARGDDPEIRKAQLALAATFKVYGIPYMGCSPNSEEAAFFSNTEAKAMEHEKARFARYIEPNKTLHLMSEMIYGKP